MVVINMGAQARGVRHGSKNYKVSKIEQELGGIQAAKRENAEGLTREEGRAVKGTRQRTL